MAEPELSLYSEGRLNGIASLKKPPQQPPPKPAMASTTSGPFTASRTNRAHPLFLSTPSNAMGPLLNIARQGKGFYRNAVPPPLPPTDSNVPLGAGSQSARLHARGGRGSSGRGRAMGGDYSRECVKLRRALRERDELVAQLTTEVGPPPSFPPSTPAACQSRQPQAPLPL